MPITGSWKSLNFDKRAGGARPSMIIIHYTGMRSEDEALHRLCDPDTKVSSHYFINENGESLNLVEDSMRAWHAGISYWDGITDINSHSIGIELVNPGHEFGYHPFPPKQMNALANLCTRLMDRYGIKPINVIGHSDIAPKRKQDPGELFPWRQLATQRIGFWPHLKDTDYSAAEDVLAEEQLFHELLVEYGYNPDVSFKNLISAFHRHFYPEKFIAGDSPEAPDSTSAAKLLALVREKNSNKT